MNEGDVVIQSNDVIKETIKRLEENKDHIILYNKYDGSEIKISNELMKIIKRYYKDRLLALEIRGMSNG